MNAGPQVDFELLAKQAQEDKELVGRLGDTSKGKFVSSLLDQQTDFSSMPFYQFAELIQNRQIRAEVIRGLKYDPTAPFDEMDHWLALSEKDQFKDYVSGKTTFAQFKASIADRRFKVKYTVFDDLKADLLP
jgi:hypothetical protein